MMRGRMLLRVIERTPTQRCAIARFKLLSLVGLPSRREGAAWGAITTARGGFIVATEERSHSITVVAALASAER